MKIPLHPNTTVHRAHTPTNPDGLEKEFDNLIWDVIFKKITPETQDFIKFRFRKLDESWKERVRGVVGELEKEKKNVPSRPLIQKGGEFERKNDLNYQERCMVYMANSSYNRSLSKAIALIEAIPIFMPSAM